jgi:hypothetical protein
LEHLRQPDRAEFGRSAAGAGEAGQGRLLEVTGNFHSKTPAALQAETVVGTCISIGMRLEYHFCNPTQIFNVYRGNQSVCSGPKFGLWVDNMF